MHLSHKTIVGAGQSTSSHHLYAHHWERLVTNGKTCDGLKLDKLSYLVGAQEACLDKFALAFPKQLSSFCF